MIYHIYRPEITTFEPSPSGEWVPSRFGTFHLTFFYPMHDEDLRVCIPGECLRTIRDGERIAHSIIPPAGSFLETIGNGQYVCLRVPDGKGTWKTFDAFNALLWAKRKEGGFSLVGDEPPKVEAPALPPPRKIAPPPAYSIEDARAEVVREFESKGLPQFALGAFLASDARAKPARPKPARREAAPSLFGDL